MASFARSILLGLLGMAAAVCAAQLSGCGRPAASAPKGRGVLTIGAASTLREGFQEIFPDFRRRWKEETGEELRFQESYLGSSAQARNIIGGFEADVAILALEGDMDKIQKAGLIRQDWRAAASGHAGIVSRSLVALAVRPGNPKQIRDWEDLARPDVEVMMSNPDISGLARWNINAIYGAALRYSQERSGRPGPQGGAPRFAADLIRRIRARVKIFDQSARESMTKFERGMGDVAVTYENEILLRLENGRPYGMVVPRATIQNENVAALVDANVDRHGTRQAARTFLRYLWSEPAQRAFARARFRPVAVRVGREFAHRFPNPPMLFTVRDLGGWPRLNELLYSETGLWTLAGRQLAAAR